jgi:hypothetical protein
MSYAAERFVLSKKIKPSANKFVMLRIAARVDNDTGEAFPSQKTLSDETSLSERTIRKIITQCVESGLLISIRRKRANGSYTTNGYSIPGFSPDFHDEDGSPIGRRGAGGDNTPTNGTRRAGGQRNTEGRWPPEDGGPDFKSLLKSHTEKGKRGAGGSRMGDEPTSTSTDGTCNFEVVS